MKSLPVMLLSLILATQAACAGRPPVTPPGGAGVSLGPVYVDQTQLISLESYPVQVVLQVDGHLPDPCHEAVWSVSGPDSLGRVQVELHSQAPAEQACIQIVAPMNLRIPLGSFGQGRYSVWLNGTQVGTISQ